MTEPRHYQII